MMKNFFYGFSGFTFSLAFILLIGLNLSSCQTSNSLAEGGIIQKRKYQKGYHLNIKDPLAFNKSGRRLIENTMEPTASLHADLPNKDIVHEPMAQASANKKVQKSTIGTRKAKRLQIKSEDFENEDISTKPKITSDYTKQNLVITPDPEKDYYAQPKRLNIMALLSFIFAILSFFIFGIPFGAAAVVLGILAVMQMENNPDVYKGKFFAIVGLVVGLIAVLILITYLGSQP